MGIGPRGGRRVRKETDQRLPAFDRIAEPRQHLQADGRIDRIRQRPATASHRDHGPTELLGLDSRQPASPLGMHGPRGSNRPPRIQRSPLCRNHFGELRQTVARIDLTLKDRIKDLFHLRLQSATERLETPSEVRKARRDVARILTIQHEKQRKVETSQGADKK